ncbi:DNA sulfur modification protein DndD [Parapedobacter luteus]|uniref:DNA sulfur modification protein DndD n=1 Tax=Parapedobacter luteus TaxID=623280 RepID=A0A1T5CT47_9SPHI|nr:AAA family ATPase [Parapedobacter luteus]SKB62639.1 DNA sulfur modification protein DndD [Parapedobacter luteus]
MFIKSVKLNDYRIYHGENELTFFNAPFRNVFIISGNNGFGKTTFLTSLIWCLYGKVMVDVDEKYRREIYEAGGYKKYAAKNLNRKTKAILDQFQLEHDEEYRLNLKATHPEKYSHLVAYEQRLASYSVQITFSDMSLPSVVCDEVTVKRTFNTLREEDTLTILIDGQQNELTKTVGPDIFIHDFILPKEIAKFFFFDAEKIVSLAEMKSIEEKQSLSKAYAEVLGIKKYEDLKNHLENIRIRMRRNSASEADRKKFDELQKEVEASKRLITEFEEQRDALQEEKLSKKVAADQYQEKLIREGSSLSVEAINHLRQRQRELATDYEAIKARMKDLMELAPFAIAGHKLKQARLQLLAEIEMEQSNLNPVLLAEKAKAVSDQLSTDTFPLMKIKGQALASLQKIVQETIIQSFSPSKKADADFKVLFAFSEAEKNEFEAIFSNLKYTYSERFKELVAQQKENRIAFNKVIRQLSDAESKENDLLIKEIRRQKNALDERIVDIDKQLLQISQEIGSLQRDVGVKNKIVAELAKKIKVEDTDAAKDEVAERLIAELNVFIKNFKTEKKSLLEKSLKRELNLLMHKADFVDKVEVEVDHDLIDIHLYDKRGQQVNKDTLSKGEQQLYATALLKALVDESNIKFPIFIDSPLQKFDKHHSANIIESFYPKVSEQVVLFPLLQKELTEDEYKLLLPRVNSAHLIKNIDDDHSTFEPVQPSKLFEYYTAGVSHV